MQGLLIYNPIRQKDPNWPNQLYLWIHTGKKKGVRLVPVATSSLNHYIKEYRTVIQMAIAVDDNDAATFMVESANIPVFNNSRATRITNDYKTLYEHLQKKSVPMAKSIGVSLTRSGSLPNDIAALYNKIGEGNIRFPFILKEPRDSQYGSSHLIEDEAQLSSIVKTLMPGPLVAQEYMNNATELTYRAVVVGRKVVAVVGKKIDSKYDSRLRDSGFYYGLRDVPREVKKLAVFAARAVGADFVAVDIAMSRFNIPVVTDMYTSFQTLPLEKATGVAISQKIIAFVKKERSWRYYRLKDYNRRQNRYFYKHQIK